jgi:hypothetical protein
MSWTFAVTQGRLINDAGVFAANAYAGGDLGTRPDAVNNVAMEGIVDVGPLPTGTYTADKVYPVHPTLGRFAIHLQPDAATTTKIINYGRNPASFYMHGDSEAQPGEHAASDGCIVTDYDTRVAFWTGTGVEPDRGLDVVSGQPVMLDQEIVS